jgi:hypothetical protein
MLIHPDHTLCVSSNEPHPRVIKFAPMKKSAATGLDGVPIGLARAQRQAHLEIFKTRPRTQDCYVQEVPIPHENRMLPLKLEANVYDRTHGGFLPVTPRENLIDAHRYHGGAAYARIFRHVMAPAELQPDLSASFVPVDNIGDSGD